MNTDIKAPVAKKVPHAIELHGSTIVDNYFWMRNLSDPDLMPHLQAENRFADDHMADTKQLQDKLYQEMRGRMEEADTSVPAKIGGWQYYSRTEAGKQYAVLCRRRDANAKEEIYLDINALAQGHEFYELGGTAISPDGNLLAYTYDNLGFRQYTLVVKNLVTGQILPVSTQRVTSLAWAADSKTLFFTTEDKTTKRSNQLYRITIDPNQRYSWFRRLFGWLWKRRNLQLVHEETDGFFNVNVSESRTGRFVYLTTSSLTTSEVSFIDAGKPDSDFRVIRERQPDVMYGVADDGKDFFIQTNKNALDGLLQKVPCDLSSPASEVLPHRPGIILRGIEVFADYLIVHESHNALPRVRIEDRHSGDVHYIAFPDAVYTVDSGTNAEFVTDTLRLHYQSMVSPPTVYDYDLKARKLTTLKVETVKGYDASLYHSERIFATVRDGTLVPMSLVYKKDLKRDGTRPCHLYGYGSYGISIPPTFSSERLSLLDRGVIFTIAHVRGGSEKGEQWRLDGKMKKKMNTFFDFIDCADHLVKLGYTSHDRLTIEGGSAGGLLMGAVLNLRPDIAKAALVEVPFVDCMNTMLDESLPLVVAEFEEWGNPKILADYEYMRQYVPYENIRAVSYPAMLVRTALHDSQVGYWEAAKYVAKQRELRTDKNPLLFKIMLETGGHSGASGRFDALKDVAYDYAFLLKQVADAAWNVA
jgi:oligopeptidase B